MPASGIVILQGKTEVNPSIYLAAYTGSCSNLINYDCESVMQGDGFVELTIDDASLVGSEVFVRVFRDDSNVESTYQICAMEGEAVTNDDCAGAIMLENTDGIYRHEAYSNIGATSSTSDASSPTCGFYQGADVWYTTIVPVTGRLVINAQSSDIDPVLSIYKGTCGAL